MLVDGTKLGTTFIKIYTIEFLSLAVLVFLLLFV